MELSEVGNLDLETLCLNHMWNEVDAWTAKVFKDGSDFCSRYITIWANNPFMPRIRSWLNFRSRYDSGIFVIQYMRCYNGVEVKQFSNVDLQAIREKVSCQLVINKFNEQQVPIAREFISKHAPHLLH